MRYVSVYRLATQLRPLESTTGSLLRPTISSLKEILSMLMETLTIPHFVQLKNCLSRGAAL